MSANFVKLESLEALSRLIERSHEEPVVLFKHSVTCGISAGVHREVSGVCGEINIVVVQDNRDISNKIAEAVGIRHESPQAIVLWAGKAVYHASHYDITAADIEDWLKPSDSRRLAACAN